MNPDRVAPSEIARSRALGVRKWLAQQPSPDIERRQKAELGDTAIEPNERESAAVSNDIGQSQRYVRISFRKGMMLCPFFHCIVFPKRE